MVDCRPEVWMSEADGAYYKEYVSNKQAVVGAGRSVGSAIEHAAAATLLCATCRVAGCIQRLVVVRASIVSPISVCTISVCTGRFLLQCCGG